MAPPTDSADPVSNAVVVPDASLFIREILEKALANPVGVAPRWSADAWALLANVLMNDYLNKWNDAGKEELKKADDAAQNALALNPELALAHNAKGLLHRARRQHREALQSFRTAIRFEPEFARGHAQYGNQKVLLGRESEAHGPLNKAKTLSPRHPASGYFYWAEGRAYFQREKWPEAINRLTKSVKALPTVWYNRVYLACAQDSNKDDVAAGNTLQEFLDNPRFGASMLIHLASSQQPNPGDPRTVKAARQRLHEWLQRAVAQL